MLGQRQTTIKRESSLVGTSLHTGNKVNLTLKPANAETGIQFKRVDLKDQPTIPAHVEFVKQVERATTISDGAIKIHTIEHLLSALRAMGIDNALIEMDSNEPPIGNGSADIFVQLIEKCGKVELEEPRQYFEIKDPIVVEGKDGSYLAALPYNGYKISCTNANHTGHFTQFLSQEITPETYKTEIADARTFVFYEEVQPLMEKGLIKGGSLENAIVIRGEQVLSKDPLRFQDEFVRHKILDIIGDLSLFPLPIKAHIIAAKPSHGLNVELTRAIVKAHKNYLTAVFPMGDIPRGEAGIDINEVMRILPHRYPFLMLDRIVKFEGNLKAIGVKSVTINEPFFQGHFPGHPVMPGVLQVEAMAQVASLLLLRQMDTPGKIGYFLSADKVKFRRPVFPGDTLFINVEMTKSRGRIGKASCKCVVNDEVVSEGDLTFAIQ
ncbi:MAG: bifunctional UDP-3-O-[3-hydroxymyristoyl] N-acetylglucosamine deacetylase/3-hydroxyacyl-ACP dehydratase [Verrucomicrobiota bacterium]